MWTVSAQNGADLHTPGGAYRSAQEYAVLAVRLEREKSGTIASAMSTLSRRGGWGSWLRKLYKNEQVSIHLHFYNRLVDIVEELVEESRRRQDVVVNKIAAERGRFNAAMEEFEGLGLPDDHALVAEARALKRDAQGG